MMKRLICRAFFMLLLTCWGKAGAQTDTVFVGYSNGIAIFSVNGKTGLIDTTGKVILPASCEWIGPAHYQCRFYKLNGKFGMMEDDGTILTEAKYDQVRFFSHFTVTAVCEGGLWGLVDNRGRQVLKPTYELIGFFGWTGLAQVKKSKNNWSFLDTTGQQVGEWYEQTGSYFQCGFCPVKRNGKWGYVNARGKQVVECRYDKCAYFSMDRLARVKTGRLYGFVDTSGKEVIPPRYSDASHFHEKLCAVKVKGKWGFIDKEGKTVVPFIYKDAGDFSGDLAPVKQGRRYGYIHSDGSTAIPFKFRKASSFYDNNTMTSVKIGWFGRRNVIDRSGKITW